MRDNMQRDSGQSERTMEGRKESGRVGENYSKRPCASCRIDDGRGASDGSLGAKYWLLLQQSADRSGEAARVGRLGPVAACSLLGGLSLGCVVTPKDSSDSSLYYAYFVQYHTW